MKKQVLTCLMMLIATMAMAQKPIEMNLWPDGPKTSNGDPNDMAKVTVPQDVLSYAVQVVATRILPCNMRGLIGLLSSMVRASLSLS